MAAKKVKKKPVKKVAKKKSPPKPKAKKLDFSKPFPVSDVDVAFPARALEIMPTWEHIPPEFRGRGTKWNRIFRDWFYTGIYDIQMFMKEGIDGETANRHLKVIAGSYAPKHEHKEAAFVYLCSLWFTDITYKVGKDPNENSADPTVPGVPHPGAGEVAGKADSKSGTVSLL